MAAQETALRKRQQIARANRMMFLWVASVSAVVGIALVLSAFLFQKLLFNEKILAVKNDTATTLTQNNKVVNDLKDQVRVLNTNEALKKNMITGETQPVQVVLDALPSDANSSAFGASLQEKFLRGDGIQVDALSVDPVVGVESSTSSNVQNASSTAPTGTNQITFQFTVSTPIGNEQAAFKPLLERLEHSIRPIDITTASLEAQGSRTSLKVSGITYYQPAKTVKLEMKTVKP